MSDFKPFSKSVHHRYTQMAKHELFVVANGEDNRALEQHYLASFPEGTNPIYLTNTEHDCSCCKNFIRHLGNVVAIIDGVKHTVWDNHMSLEYPYNVVGAAMQAFVLAQPIVSIFRTTEGSYGAEQTLQNVPGAAVKRWNHFHGTVSAAHKATDPGTQIGAYNAAVQVFRRGLNELSPAAVVDVLNLIQDKALYRGEEHEKAVRGFKVLHEAYQKLDAAGRELFIWQNAKLPAAQFRNTVIGTLVIDLSAGVDLETAVASFESKVAPTNYKRPKALITPRMVEDAMKTIKGLDLEPALERRFARLSDISVNNVLWVDNAAQAQMKGGIAATLMAATKATVKTDKAQAISIDEFMQRVLPGAIEMEVYPGNQHLANFVSLTAPVHADTARLFKWNNDFAWSYDGNVTDSIKERVKKAGGNVTNAAMRVSLAWFNFDDLDIHVYEPNGNRIYFGNKGNKLDVDMNAGGRHSRTPVENVSWLSSNLADGKYKVLIDQFSQRETTDVGCVVEIENKGKIVQLSHPTRVSKSTPFCEITVKGGEITAIVPATGILAQGISQEKWGIKTEAWAKVSTLMHSPNYWDGNAVGNKHHLFFLDDCVNPDPTRGIYNEFLSSNLDKHRKVFEVLGDRTRCQPIEGQLSGLGFSSTQGDAIVVRVKSATSTMTYNLQF